MLVFHLLRPWLRSHWRKWIKIWRSFGMERASSSKKSNQCSLSPRMDFVIHFLGLTADCPCSSIGRLIHSPGELCSQAKVLLSLWDDFSWVLEKLGQPSQKSVHQSPAVVSVGPNKTHIWRSRGCNYNDTYLRNLKSKLKSPRGKSITKIKTVFLRIDSEAI